MENSKVIDDKIDNIIEVTDKIKPNELTILVGENGSGKSMVRKQMNFAMKRLFPDRDIQKLTASVSMQKRTETAPEFGALCTAFHDLEWLPTSISTYNLIQGLFETFKDPSKDKRYIIIDEPEIGMSRESQMGIALYLLKNLPLILENSLGLLIITHSEDIVKILKDNGTFINLNNNTMTADEWLNREVVPTDFDLLEKDSNELFQGIKNRQRGN